MRYVSHVIPVWNSLAAANQNPAPMRSRLLICLFSPSLSLCDRWQANKLQIYLARLPVPDLAELPACKRRGMVQLKHAAEQCIIASRRTNSFHDAASDLQSVTCKEAVAEISEISATSNTIFSTSCLQSKTVAIKRPAAAAGVNLAAFSRLSQARLAVAHVPHQPAPR